MADQLSKGQTVQLVSGGPPMAVLEITNGMAECQWFEGGKSNKLKKGDFPVEALRVFRRAPAIVARFR